MGKLNLGSLPPREENNAAQQQKALPTLNLPTKNLER